MKIRIKGNSIRFRLTKSEVAQFCKEGQVTEKTSFETSTFTYAVVQDHNVKNLFADFKNNAIILSLPKEMAHDWDGNSRVGFESKMVLKNGEEVFLLLEKDFTCLENREEDQSDNYPNPKLV